MQNQCSSEASVKLRQKPIKRTRKKSSYRKINNENRQKLIEMVYLKDFLLKDAAKMLNINYSTAKTILRIFRMEKRISKKNSPDLNCLNQIRKENLKKFKIIRNNKTEFNDRNKSELAFESISNSTFSTNTNSNINNNSNCFNHQQLLIKNIQEAFPALMNEINLFNLNSNENSNENISLALNILNKADSEQNDILNNKNHDYINDIISDINNNFNFGNTNRQTFEQANNLILYTKLSDTIQNLATMISVCYENLQFNQNMINLIINQMSGKFK